MTTPTSTPAAVEHMTDERLAELEDWIERAESYMGGLQQRDERELLAEVKRARAIEAERDALVRTLNGICDAFGWQFVAPELLVDTAEASKEDLDSLNAGMSRTWAERDALSATVERLRAALTRLVASEMGERNARGMGQIASREAFAEKCAAMDAAEELLAAPTRGEEAERGE